MPLKKNQLKGLLKKEKLEPKEEPKEEPKVTEFKDDEPENEKVELTDEQKAYLAMENEKEILQNNGTYRRAMLIELKKLNYLIAKFYHEMSGKDPFSDEDDKTD